MSILTLVIAIFSVLGALDLILGNRFGIGKEFEKGFMYLGSLVLTMAGMIVIAPLISQMLAPLSDFVYSATGIDPSVFPAMLLANDMGGASLSEAIAKSGDIGAFNALVVSSMMGCTLSFTIPLATVTLRREREKNPFFLGCMYGIAAIPAGCFVSGLMLKIPLSALLLDISILLCFSVIIALGMAFFKNICIKAFSALGYGIKAVIIAGLAAGAFQSLTGIEIIKGLASLKDAAIICLNAAAVMSGTFPLMYIISKLLKKPLKLIGKKAGINEASAFGFLSSLITNIPTLSSMDKMDQKGIVLNSAFAVSASFVLAGHLAFTMALNEAYVFPMIAGKLVSGIAAVALALVLYKGEKENV